MSAKLLQRAQAAHRAGDLDQARALYVECLAKRRDAGVQMSLAACEADRGDFGTAIRLLEEASSAKHPPPGARDLLARVLRADARRRHAAGDAGGALSSMRRAAGLAPADATVLHDLGALELMNGSAAAAVKALRSSLVARPGSVETLHNLALAQRAIGDHSAAIETLQSACEAAPQRADLLCDLAACYEADGQQERAQASFEAALKIEPAMIDAQVGLASLAYWRGDLDRTSEILDPLLALDPVPPPALVLASRTASDADLPRVADRLADALADPQLGTWHTQGWFALGAAREKLERYDEAWAAYTEGNAARHRSWDRTAHSAWVDTQITDWSVETLRRTSSSDDQRPIFIVGMPRSGTSLVEQILACHPHVHAAGERSELAELASSLPEDADTGALAEAADRYLESVLGDEACERFTDKMPLNFLHLGAANALFPACRVIHCRRAAADIAVSCFATDFTDPQLGFSADIDDLATYLEDYRRLMSHWKEVLNVPIIDVDYEALVADPEPVIRSLLEALDLPWDARCLEPHALDRPVRTTSFDQVRRPIYSSSVGRYRRFGDRLDAIEHADA